MSVFLRWFLLVLWPVIVSPLTAAADEAAVGAKIIEWDELVPPGWQPPLIAIAHDEAIRRPVPTDSLVSGLDDQRVQLPGFMKPVVFQERTVTEFLLVPYLPHHVKNHAHLEANQMIYVMAEVPVEVDNPLTPIWVSGTLQLKTVTTDEGPVGYSMINARVWEYRY